MNQNPLVYPTTATIDLETSITSSVLNAGLYVYQTAMKHKFKSGLLIACLMGTYKTYGLFKTFRDITGGVS